MTENQPEADERGESTRRDVLKTGAAAAAGIGLASAGTATAQDGDDDIIEEQGGKALIFTNQFRPGARFVITSRVLDWVPNVPDVQDSVWSNYNTRNIRYLNTNEIVPFFIAQDAEIPPYKQQFGYVVDDEGDFRNGTQQPEVYEMNRQWEPFGDNPNLFTVQFSPVNEDEEDDVLEDDDWWV
ncbi:twin-arginine translocation signal domain-containing protein [Halegenticoccus soli]|uniref:twin-arginine translocation signal domain-containing protein n=1 Tax=Halegenticoccus soli TaxID=1985678 RepID=UPI000C6DF321|nr:twin-arginine translocation signal domain-containing protein [Halegenticoccus soli]